MLNVDLFGSKVGIVSHSAKKNIKKVAKFLFFCYKSLLLRRFTDTSFYFIL